MSFNNRSRASAGGSSRPGDPGGSSSLLPPSPAAEPYRAALISGLRQTFRPELSTQFSVGQTGQLGRKPGTARRTLIGGA